MSKNKSGQSNQPSTKQARPQSEGESSFKYADRNKAYEVPDSDVSLLNKMLGRTFELEELPPAVLDSYWRAKEMADRASLNMTNEQLLLMVLLFADTEHLPPPKADVSRYFKHGELSKLDWIEIRFRDEWVRAQIIAARPKEVLVIREGDVTQWWVSVGDCRLLGSSDEATTETVTTGMSEHAAEHAGSIV